MDEKKLKKHGFTIEPHKSGFLIGINQNGKKTFFGLRRSDDPEDLVPFRSKEKAMDIAKHRLVPHYDNVHDDPWIDIGGEG